MDKKKILLFGGTFNPIHNGHLIVARIMAEAMGMNKVVLIPNGDPPHKEKVISKTHRYEMLKRAIRAGKNDDPLFDICRYEIEKLTPSYAIKTIRYFKKTLGDTIDKPYWMIGPDNLQDLKNWYKIDELAKECIFLVGIGPYNSPELFSWVGNKAKEFHEKFDIQTVVIPNLDIRSTDIRNRVKKGLSIRHYVPDAVEEYIRDNGIYANNKQLTAI